MKKAIREMYVYGTTIRFGCSKQRPYAMPNVFVRTTADKLEVNDTFNNNREAILFVNRILANYIGCNMYTHHNYVNGRNESVMFEYKIYDVFNKEKLVTVQLIAK